MDYERWGFIGIGFATAIALVNAVGLLSKMPEPSWITFSVMLVWIASLVIRIRLYRKLPARTHDAPGR